MKNKKEFIDLIDKTVVGIYKFSENNSSSINRLFLIVLSQTKFEVVSTGEITDYTARALTQLCVFQNQELYYLKDQTLYQELGLILFHSNEYNRKMQDNEIVALGSSQKSWTDYFEMLVEK